jgi:cell division protein FtsI (penicillin-binding protein 3)
MSAKDALALLENLGMRVQLRGSGKVTRQSVATGTKFNINDLILLDLQ